MGRKAAEEKRLRDFIAKADATEPTDAAKAFDDDRHGREDAGEAHHAT